MLRVYIGDTRIAEGSRNSSYVAELINPVTGDKAVQIEELIRAEQPTFFDRLTVRNQLQFTIHKQVSDYVQALHRTFFVRQELAGTGAIIFEVVVGSALHRWKAARAGWTSTSANPLGAAVAIRYTVTCGKFTYEMQDSGEEPDPEDPPPEWAAETLGGRDVTQPIATTKGGRHILHPALITYGGRTLT